MGKNHPAFEEYIEEWDEPVLEYLKDITTEDLDPKESNNGFKIEFVFQDNPYFEEKVLWKEYVTKEGSPYTPGDMDMEEIKASPISWKSGKNITVVKTSKKKKCGGKKKTEVKEEVRKSFFRFFFKNLKPGEDLPEDIPDDVMDEDDSDGDPGQLMEMLMENDHESGMHCEIRSSLMQLGGTPVRLSWKWTTTMTKMMRVATVMTRMKVKKMMKTTMTRRRTTAGKRGRV